MLEPKHNQPPRSGEPQPPVNLDDLSDLRHPERSSPLMQQRLLYEAYLNYAAKGQSSKVELMSSPRQMSFDNKIVFDKLERNVCSSIDSALRAHGLSSERADIEVRVLHQRIANHPEGPEYHAYFEVFNQSRFSILAYGGTVERFSEGPAALQGYVRPGEDEAHVRIVPLLSRAAFDETVDKLVHDVRTEGAMSPSSNWAAYWVLQALKGQKEFIAAISKAKEGNPEMGDKKIALVMSPRTATPALEFNLGQLSCRAELSFDEARQKPGVYMNFSPGPSGTGLAEQS